MATQTHDKAASGFPLIGASQRGECKAIFASLDLSAAPALNDTYDMLRVPKGATVFEVVLQTDDLDASATPTIVLDVGDSGSANRFISGSMVAQSGGRATGVFHPYTYTADDTITVKVSTGPATGQTGKISVYVLYSMDD